MVSWLRLDINPEPWAIGPVGYGRRNGKMSAYVGQNAQLDSFKQAVAEAAQASWELPPLEGPIKLDFFFWRNRAMYRTDSGRNMTKSKVDATNMQKATEDALQGVVYKNDRDVVDVRSRVVEQGPEVSGLIVVRVQLLEEGYAETFVEGIPQAMLIASAPIQRQDDNVWPPRKA